MEKRKIRSIKLITINLLFYYIYTKKETKKQNEI